MRDPFSWSIPLGRLFGIVIRIHVLFPLIALSMVLRASYAKPPYAASEGLWIDACIVVFILFLSVLLHEFGHCFAARSVEGDAQEVLLWPLGGLANVEVPHAWRANLITAAGGPAVNLLLCSLTAGILAALSFVPPLNPWSDPYRPTMYNWATQTDYRHPNGASLIYVGEGGDRSHVRTADNDGMRSLSFSEVLLARVFFVNWVLLLLNILLPGFPLDGGRILQCLIWARSDYRQGTLYAIYAGFVVCLILGIYGIVVDGFAGLGGAVLPILLAWFIFVNCRHQWIVLENGGDDNLFGYDFSQGYTSLERDQPATAPRRKQPNFVQRWLQKRAQRKLQRAQETREAEERRMDELLEKVQQQGLQSLTDEERRFLTRVSALSQSKLVKQINGERGTVKLCLFTGPRFSFSTRGPIVPQLIDPRTLKGFRDYPPELMIPREQMVEKARRVFRSYGFAPIDTPALEYTEILLGKMGADSEVQKIIYRFKDHGDRDVALRFDLTVPFARFAAQHIGKLGTPFKRYHMGPVWRGENTAAGRFREFWQCDFDTIGTKSNAADIETGLVIHDLMRGLGIERFQIRVNNRLVLNGLLEELGLAEKSEPLLRSLDKLGKVSREGVQEEMVKTAGVTAEQADRVLALAQAEGSNQEIIERLRRDFGGNAKAADGTARLAELLSVMRTAGIAEENIRLDLSIARGLDYYTGTIYETFFSDLPGIGSVCSGGRYNNLAGLYTKQDLPGVGASLGLDRLLDALEKLNLLPKTATPAPVLIVQFDAQYLGEYQKMARMLRAEGIGVEVFPDAKKVGQQLTYAEKRGFSLAIIAGSNEFTQGVWKIKDMRRKKEDAVELTVPTAEVSVTLRRLLAGTS